MQSVDNSQLIGDHCYHLYWVYILIRHYSTTGRKYKYMYILYLLKYVLNKHVHFITQILWYYKYNKGHFFSILWFDRHEYCICTLECTSEHTVTESNIHPDPPTCTSPLVACTVIMPASPSTQSHFSSWCYPFIWWILWSFIQITTHPGLC